MDQEAGLGAGYLARSPHDREIIDSIIAGAAPETLENGSKITIEVLIDWSFLSIQGNAAYC